MALRVRWPRIAGSEYQKELHEMNREESGASSTGRADEVFTEASSSAYQHTTKTEIASQVAPSSSNAVPFEASGESNEFGEWHKGQGQRHHVYLDSKYTEGEMPNETCDPSRDGTADMFADEAQVVRVLNMGGAVLLEITVGAASAVSDLSAYLNAGAPWGTSHHLFWGSRALSDDELIFDLLRDVCDATEAITACLVDDSEDSFYPIRFERRDTPYYQSYKSEC